MAEQTKEQEAKRSAQEEEVLGKAYDGRLMRRLLVYLRPYKLQVGISIVAILLKAAADILGPFLTMLAVNKYMGGNVGTSPSHTARFLHLPDTSRLTAQLSPRPLIGIAQLAGVYLLAITLTFILEFLQTYLMQWTGQKVMFDLRSQIFRHIQRMHVGFFDRNPVGRLVTRVTSDVDALNEMFTSGVLAIFEDVFVLLFIVIIMLAMNWWLALITLAVIPGILYATQIFRTYVRESYRRIRTAIAHINAYTQEHVSGMSIVQLFNREQRAFRDFSAVNRLHMEAFKDTVLSYSLYYPAVDLLSAVAISCVIWLGGGSTLHSYRFFSTVSIGVVVAFIQYAQRFFRPIQDLSEKYNILQAAMAASERIFKLLDTQTGIVSPAHPIAGDRSGRIEFRDVWFTYESLSEMQLSLISNATEDELREMTGIEWVLRGVSFVIEQDQTAAIVGHTGAGKTTITSLMMRFYDIQRGSILIDGVDVREQELTALRRRFGVVLQDPFLFSGTIADNIRLGSKITDERMKRAAEEVNVADFIESLPGQYTEPVRERGSTLSTGQKQLISFARALAHDPGILILDEATSSVDTETELRVRSA
ncbi:MAG TPA: ABC transporter ATP-binding protein, partial [Acidobacteriaceae bacterium]|nr:ABC transporter ATP-binding protein [Acidobacteriaceae bacterium]